MDYTVAQYNPLAALLASNQGYQVGSGIRNKNAQGEAAPFLANGDYSGALKALMSAGGDTDTALAFARLGQEQEQSKQLQAYRQEDLALRSRPDVPAGFQLNGAGLSYIPGGPADPSYKSQVEPKAAGNPPAGYIWADPSDPSKGYKIPPNSPAGKLPEGAAGAISMMDAADKELSTVAPGGGTLKDVLTKPYDASYGAAHYARDSYLQRGEVGRAQRAIRTKVEAALRMMTGAAAPTEEVDRYAGFYTPSADDTKETAAQKLRLLDDFAKNARTNMLQGRSSETGNTLETPPADDGWTDLGNGVRIRQK